ncbi:hypothetical protein [Georgenia muralis]
MFIDRPATDRRTTGDPLVREVGETFAPGALPAGMAERGTTRA